MFNGHRRRAYSQIDSRSTENVKIMAPIPKCCPTCVRGRIPTLWYVLLSAAGRREGPDRPGLTALIFLPARPMPGPTTTVRRRATANRPPIFCVWRRSLARTLPARRQVRQYCVYISVCRVARLPSANIWPDPTTRHRQDLAATTIRVGAQEASGIRVAGNISAPMLAATLAADTCMESRARWA